MHCWGMNKDNQDFLSSDSENLPAEVKRTINKYAFKTSITNHISIILLKILHQILKILMLCENHEEQI